jgi:hypothetical protein
MYYITLPSHQFTSSGATLSAHAGTRPKLIRIELEVFVASKKTPLSPLMKESRSSPGPLKQTPIPISPSIEKIGLLPLLKIEAPH